MGHEREGIHARDILLTEEGSCIAAGGGFGGDPLAVELDMDTGDTVRTLTDEGWFTLLGSDYGTGTLLLIGHNMLCDGADSETMIIGPDSGDPYLPLSITGHGATRCRTVISAGDSLYVFGEVSECWDGHQDIWAAATVRGDWIPAETGSRLNADFQ